MTRQSSPCIKFIFIKSFVYTILHWELFRLEGKVTRSSYGTNTAFRVIDDIDSQHFECGDVSLRCGETTSPLAVLPERSVCPPSSFRGSKVKGEG